LIRTLQPHHALFPLADGAIQRFPQNLIELWAVATRPIEHNGLGLSTSSAAAELERIKVMFLHLPDAPAIYPASERLVIQHQVSGKPTHDARLVAAMLVHGVTAILTFDKPGFPVIPASRLCTQPT
jgi:predicted nucleic acid-binding protein